MKIKIRDIGPNGLNVNDHIALEPLNVRMNEAKSNDIIFTSDPEVEINVRKTPNGAEIKGVASAKFNQPCSLCIKELDRTIKAELNFVFQRRSSQAVIRAKDKNFDDDFYQDDIGITYFDGEFLELENLIQECIILSLDPYYRPVQDENKNCTICGKNCSAKSQVLF